MPLGDVIKSYCRICRGDRNCETKGFFAQSGGDGDYFWNVDWHILQCRGCEETFCLTIATNSEAMDHDYDDQGNAFTINYETKEFWPARIKRIRPDWLGDRGIIVESEIGENTNQLNMVLVELYRALENDLFLLATIGLRTGFDVASALLGIDTNQTFERKLVALGETGRIDQQDAEHLSILVSAGNASAHRGWLPNASQLDVIVEIFERFLRRAFVEPVRERAHKDKVEKLKASVPPKAKRKKLAPKIYLAQKTV